MLFQSVAKVLDLISDISYKKCNTSLVSVEHQYPNLKLVHNLPIRNHSVKFTTGYNQITKEITYSISIYGHNRSNRMKNIAAITHLESSLRKIKRISPPKYNQKTSELEIKFNIQVDDLKLLQPICTDLIDATMAPNALIKNFIARNSDSLELNKIKDQLKLNHQYEDDPEISCDMCKLVALLPEEERYNFISEHQLIQNGDALRIVIGLLPEDKRLLIAKQFWNKITRFDQFSCALSMLTDKEKDDFICFYEQSIDNAEQLAVALSYKQGKVDGQELLNYAVEFIKSKNLEDSRDLRCILNSLSKDLRYELLDKSLDKYLPGNELSLILALLPPDDFLKFVRTKIHLIDEHNFLNFLARTDPNYLLSITLIKALSTQNNVYLTQFESTFCNKHFQIDFNRIDEQGDTPITAAVKSNNLAVLEFLIRFKANINTPNNMNETPIMLARQLNHYEIIELLLKNDAVDKSLNELSENPVNPPPIELKENLVNATPIALKAIVIEPTPIKPKLPLDKSIFDTVTDIIQEEIKKYQAQANSRFTSFDLIKRQSDMRVDSINKVNEEITRLKNRHTT